METYYQKNGISVRRSNRQDVHYLESRLKASDVKEVWASNHFTPKEALDLAVDESLFALTVCNGHPIAMFGIYAESVLGDSAIIWLLSSPELDKIGVRFVRNCRKFINMMLEYYPELYNYVDCRNERTIKWLKMLGAKFDEPKPFGMDNLPFMRFVFRR